MVFKIGPIGQGAPKKSTPTAVIRHPASAEKLMWNINPNINITQEAYPKMKRMIRNTGFDSPSFQDYIVKNSKVITTRLLDMGHKVNGKLTLSSKNINDVVAIVKAISK